MISASEIKFVKSLALKKFRKQHGLFIAEGEKIVNELIASDLLIEKVFATEDFMDLNQTGKKIQFQKVNDKELERISQLTTPNKVLALVKIPERDTSELHISNKLSLVLDGIQDPGNLGTIIRTADWFGIENIICSEESAEVYNPKVIQATMGSFIRVKVFYTSLVSFLSKLQSGTLVAGAHLKGENLYETKLPNEGVLVIGNESKGISDSILRFVNKKIRIPEFSSGHKKKQPESLNAAIATGILLYEIRRK